ncbi:MAG: hypothetical protein WCB75_14550, partial [Pseudolabrys sp.]
RKGRQPGDAGGQMQKLSTGKFHSEPPSRFTSLDHLVGEREQRKRYGQTEHSRGLSVDNQLDLGRLHCRQAER